MHLIKMVNTSTRTFISRPKWLLSLNSNLTAQNGEKNFTTITKTKAEQSEYGEISYTLEPVELSASTLNPTGHLQNLEIITETTSGATRIIVPFLIRTDHLKQTKKGIPEDNDCVRNLNETPSLDRKNVKNYYCQEENQFFLDSAAKSVITQSTTKKTSAKRNYCHNYTPITTTTTTTGLSQSDLTKTSSLESNSQEITGIMEYDLVEDLNGFIKDEELDDVDFSNYTTTTIQDQIDNTITPLNGQQTYLTNMEAMLEQNLPTNQPMEFDVDEDLFYEYEEPFNNGNLNMGKDFSNVNSQLSGNEESINLSAPATIIDNYNIDNLDPNVIMQENLYAMDIYHNSQSSIQSSFMPYSSILKSNPMLAADPNIVMPKQLWTPTDDSNQMASSQDSLFNSWTNTVEIEKQIKDYDTNNNKNNQSREEYVDKKRKNNIEFYDEEESSKLIKLNIPATTIQESGISTPEIVEKALSLEESYASKSSNYSSPSSPIDVEKEQSIFVIIKKEDNEDILDNPPSVQSYISENVTSSNFSTAPPTPSCSTDNPITPQKRRGRPPKLHSHKPNPSELIDLPESERKYREQRYKNNEASRQSRLNRKQKEERDKTELENHEAEYETLKARYEECKSKHAKLHQLLCELLKR